MPAAVPHEEPVGYRCHANTGVRFLKIARRRAAFATSPGNARNLI
jgi:hypothetical protein